jgi:L-lactate dehydrogenase complex protein LldG
MTERDKILGRIREALTISAPGPGQHNHHSAPQPAAHGPMVKNASDWLPLVGEAFEARVAAFRTCSTELKTDFYLLDSEAEVKAKLREICQTENWRQVASHGEGVAVTAAASLDLPVLRTDSQYDVVALEKCDAGITECDALVAQTGSVLVTSRSAGGRALSVLPPHHVVIARREQLLADLPAAFGLLKKKYASDYPSFISFITGPSRTGDIERILVLGAHGPKKLTVLAF